MGADLFGYFKTDKEVTLENARKVDGLKLFFDFITPEEEVELLNSIDKMDWLLDLKRRVQHYGYKYDYRTRQIDKSFYIGEMPDWTAFLWKRLLQQGIINFVPDQAIINEYINDQGIAPHIDCEPCFDHTIISISLGGHCVMTFQNEGLDKSENKVELFVPAKTALIMTGESRYSWLHGIPARKSDIFNGKIHKRQRRVSVTFRKIILHDA